MKKGNIKVVDSLMGTGKTTKAIERMKKNKSPFIYVTPFLNEVQRIKDNVPDILEPKVSSNIKYDGEKVINYKRDSLLIGASKKSNLVTTHKLFASLHRNDVKFFEDYDLILDEVLMPLEIIDMSSDDIDIAFNEGLLVLNKDTGQVTYTGDDYGGRLYSKLKSYCESANVFYVDDRFLVSVFPPELFINFKSVTVLTYMFEGSLLSSYFKYYNIDYEVVKPNKENEIKIRKEVQNLLNIYEGVGNKYGENEYAFSVNWLKKRNSKDIKQIKTTVANLLTRKFKTVSSLTVFTTYKEFQGKLKGKGYSRGFIPVNERATNKYSEKDTMIYLANRYLKPDIINFFRVREVEVDKDMWALSELLQWLWRGAIRNGKEMNVYIPSRRMRNLLLNWLYQDEINKIAKVA